MSGPIFVEGSDKCPKSGECLQHVVVMLPFELLKVATVLGGLPLPTLLLLDVQPVYSSSISCFHCSFFFRFGRAWPLLIVSFVELCFILSDE